MSLLTEAQQVELRPIEELQPYPLNPRSITEKRYNELKQKVNRFGQLGTLIIDGRDKSTVLGGNHVFRAMQELGYTKAKVEYRTPKDDAEALEIVILHNEKFATWVEQDLAELLHKYREQIDLSNYTIDLGKATDALKILARYGQTNEDDAPAVEAESYSQQGHLYQLGRHRLYCGDSTKPETFDTLFGDDQADMIITDPPYGVSYEGNPNGEEWNMIANDDLRGNELQQFLTAAFTHAGKYAKAHAGLYSFYASSTHREFQNALEIAGWTVRQQIIWLKKMVIGNSHYHWTHEPILYCGKGKESPDFNGDRTHKTLIDTVGYEDLKKLDKAVLINLIQSFREQSTVVRATQDRQKYDHPTQKPVSIMTPFIKNSAPVGGIVLDMFAGSGSSLVAAHQLDRIAYVVEFSPQFADVIRKRYAKLIGEESRWQEATPQITYQNHTK